MCGDLRVYVKLIIQVECNRFVNERQRKRRKMRCQHLDGITLIVQSNKMVQSNPMPEQGHKPAIVDFQKIG